LLEFDDAADGGHRHALVGHGHYVTDDANLHPGVAALPPGRALRRHDLEVVDPSQEGLLDRKHVRHLANGEQRDVLILKRFHDSPP